MSENTSITPRPRVLSGMRPTGRLHLGNYMGALYNWVQLQHQYECYFFIADYHALTTDYADPSQLKQNIYEMALDFLAAGLDPDRCTIFVQSHVPQHAELHLLLSMITPVTWLERVPTYKDQQEQLKEKDLATYGFLGYPLLQSADILVYQAQFVPVGQDQAAHVEITREIARRFNFLYPRISHLDKARVPPGGDPIGRLENGLDDKQIADALKNFDHPILPEPEVMLTPSPKLPGTDGRKMSKSYGNTILMTDPLPIVMQKAQSMSNGGQRPTQSDPGDPEICPVGDLHRVFSTADVDDHIRKGCRTASIRCDECKNLVGISIAKHTQPIFNRRLELESDPDRVWKILEEGSLRAEKRAEITMEQVRVVTGVSRDRSGVRFARSAQTSGENNDPRNLGDLRAWWDIESPILIKNLRDYWRRAIVPVETTLLKGDSEDVSLTHNGRRVLSAAARQEPSENAWRFTVKPKTYEIMVLLCWGKDLQLHDFVIPQKMYVGPWSAAKKRAGKDNVEFSVSFEAGRYLLTLPHFSSIDITETEMQYSVIG